MSQTTAETAIPTDIQPVGQPLVENVVNVQDEKRNRSRNYSFLHKNPESLDAVELGDSKYAIPAAIGSSYWAILKVFYEHVNQPVLVETLLEEVSSLMMDRNPEEWESYCGKKETTVHSKTKEQCQVQAIKPWQERILNNAKTLTRLGGASKYGQRLYERGHVLIFGYDKNSRPIFTLYTSLDVLEKMKKTKEEAKAAKIAKTTAAKAAKVAKVAKTPKE